MRYSCGHGHDPCAFACPVCMVEVRTERDAYRSVLKGAHGALMDAGDVPVPQLLSEPIAPAIERLTRDLASARTALAEAKGADPAMAEYVAASLAWWLDDSDEAGNLDGPSWQRYWNAYYSLPVEVRRGAK